MDVLFPPMSCLRSQFLFPSSRRRKCCLRSSTVTPNRKRFVFRTCAALDPQTLVVVVAVSAAAAISVFYFNRKPSSSNKKSKHSGPITHKNDDEQTHHQLLSAGNTIPATITPSSVEEPFTVMEMSSQDTPPKQKHVPILMLESELIAASIPTKNMLALANVIEQKNIEECDVTSFNFTPTNNGLHSFYESNHYATSSMENINRANAMPELSSFGNNGLSSSVTTSLLHTERFSTNDFLLAAEKFEATLPNGKSGSYPLSRKGHFWKKGTSSSHKEISVLTKDDLKTLFPVSHLKKQGHTLDYPAQQLRAYHRFLKEGRLADSLEKLEYLERKGLLDMNKVYHMGFLSMCRSQKAVKEAFRFVNLIRNPTLSTFNMLMSVCGFSQDLDGGFEVLKLVQKAGLKADCKLYTTLISTCAKSKKVDTMFKVFHEMVNSGVEPNVHTYGALIDGCAKAGQVAKAFGAYGIMRSKNVKPDRIVFNALISACGESGAVDRAFDVLSEMRSETHPIDPDHVTVWALMKACVNAG